jgi:hypothetical protein|nr:FxLYD domain-containing protein [uncultured Methanoregula sp.]
MSQPNSLPELMEQLKRRRKMKYRNTRLTAVYVFLGLTIIGSFICFILVSTPLMSYLIPFSGSNGGSSATPSYSLNTIMISSGIPDAESDLRISDAELLRDGTGSWVTGTITNSGTQPYKGFSIQYDLFDIRGKLMGSTFVMMGGIAPNESKKFRTTPFRGQAVSARLNAILGT